MTICVGEGRCGLRRGGSLAPARASYCDEPKGAGACAQVAKRRELGKTRTADCGLREMCSMHCEPFE
eukprot:795938-Rhodomonas_salina.1